MDRDFKGVWIPKEIWLNTDLTITEKVLLVEIDSLDKGHGCFKSNAKIGEFLGTTESAVAKMISGLRKKKYIIDLGFDGRKRFIGSKYSVYNSTSQPLQKVNPDFTKSNHSNTVSINIDKEEEIFPFKIGETEASSIQEYVSRYGRLRVAFEKIFLDSGATSYEESVKAFEDSLSGFADFTDDNHLKNSFKKFISIKQQEEKEKKFGQKKKNNYENDSRKFNSGDLSELDNRPKRRFIAGEEL